VHQDKECVYNDGSIGPITQKLRNALEDITSGIQAEILKPFMSWNMLVA